MKLDQTAIDEIFDRAYDLGPICDSGDLYEYVERTLKDINLVFKPDDSSQSVLIIQKVCKE